MRKIRVHGIDMNDPCEGSTDCGKTISQKHSCRRGDHKNSVVCKSMYAAWVHYHRSNTITMFRTWRLLICCIFTTCFAQKLTISQTPALIVNTTGQEVLMNCEQLTTDHDWMFWYHQEKGQGLKLIARKLKNQSPDYEGSYEKTYEMGSKGGKHSSLKIKSLTSQSQGVYFCASSDTQ